MSIPSIHSLIYLSIHLSNPSFVNCIYLIKSISITCLVSKYSFQKLITGVVRIISVKFVSFTLWYCTRLKNCLDIHYIRIVKYNLLISMLKHLVVLSLPRPFKIDWQFPYFYGSNIFNFPLKQRRRSIPSVAGSISHTFILISARVWCPWMHIMHSQLGV